MRLSRTADPAGPIVQGFAPGGFRLGDGTVHRALLLTWEAAGGWSPPPFDALATDDLAEILSVDPEFILLGTGATLARPPLALRQALAARHLGLEAMDSRAAARAWGVLRGEGRRIAAALYPLA